MGEFIAWLIDLFGPVVLDWTIREVQKRLSETGAAFPGEQAPHCGSCSCETEDPDFDADELGIDPEGEGWRHD